MNNLGMPYSQDVGKRGTTHNDCSSFVGIGCVAAGVPFNPKALPNTAMLLESKYFETVEYSKKLPGDLIFLKPEKPGENHVGIVLADNYMVHTNTKKDVSHVKRVYSKDQTLRILRLKPRKDWPKK